MRQSLEGIRILDLTRVLAGPFATMVMADLGADVVKVEVPGVGDDSRHFGPYLHGESTYFMSINRNKRSIVLNLKQKEDKAIFVQLAASADVVVENFRPGTMEKLGIGYEELKISNPDLIYAAVSGFGHSGPYSQRPAYDAVVQAMGGLISITGPEGGSGVRVGTSIGDITSGLFCVIGILSALRHRDLTGEGQKVDVAMLDCQVAILENAISRFLITGEIPRPAGNRHPSIAPFESFPTQDGELMIAAGNDVLFQKLSHELGHDEWPEMLSFQTNPMRVQNVRELAERIGEETRKKTTLEWQGILDEAGVPNGPINTVDRVIADPQVLSRQMIQTITHPVAGQVAMAGVPIKMSRTQGEIRKSSPMLGEHQRDVLLDWLGVDIDKNS